MSEREAVLFNTQFEKLEDICKDHGLECELNKVHYPITFIVWGKVERFEQMSLVENSGKECKNAFDGRVIWTLENGELVMRVEQGRITMSKALRTKIEAALLKAIGYWQQYFFRYVTMNRANGRLMLPAEAKIIPVDAEPVEDYEEED
ncbi:MAG: hypothetical protein J6B49_01055 [Phascolarctobacterium sp.]|nr:hypothetical protein [Phascolarctobacterium sp.]MBR6637205.1 hypothetical protein [Phascolarctobacterium sp.]